MIVQTLPRYLRLAISGLNVICWACPRFIGPAVVSSWYLGSGNVCSRGAGLAVGFLCAALMIATGNLLAFTLAIWLRVGSLVATSCHPRVAFDRPLIVQKLKLYGRLLSGKVASDWIRTERRK